MAKSVNQAFNIFLTNYVNLGSTETQSARDSRDWLLSQIHSFPEKVVAFPKLYPDRDIAYGSFARRTKKKPLDDIDIMVALNGAGGSYLELSDKIEIYVSDYATELRNLCFDGTSILNSRKVVNKFVDALSKVPQYQKAEVKRNSEAATLKLKSYTWNFDLVPCFFTQKDSNGRDYYLIPDGKGDWKKTDPRIDRQRVSDINQLHSGNLLNVIRLMKYWNRRPTMPSMSSYLIENIILDFYASQTTEKASQHVSTEVPKLLNRINTQIFLPVYDPKGIQGDINSLELEDRTKISKRAYADYLKSLEGSILMLQGNHKEAIAKWTEIFGPNFPDYTE